MDRTEKQQRLKSLLGNISGEEGVESLIREPSFGLESLESMRGEGTDQTVDAAFRGLKKLERNEPLTDQESFGLEAIILPRERPVVFVRNNTFDQIPDPWTHFASDTIRRRIEGAIPAIGRIELPDNLLIPYGGTGFVVGENLLMTNRHVAELFTSGLGLQGLAFRVGQTAKVNFKREQGDADDERSIEISVCKIVMIHPFWDMALLEVAGLPSKIIPLALSLQTPEDLNGTEVAVVGYPARDNRSDLQLQDRIFSSVYSVKRLQPGKLGLRSRITSFSNVVNAMTHDSSTLGGNSGSAIVDVNTGQVVGLHFAGIYLKSNYAVPTYELARDKRVVDAGVKFASGSVAPTDEWLAAWKLADPTQENTSSPSVTPAPILAPDTSQQAVHPVSHSGFAGASWTIPLEITVSLGGAIPKFIQQSSSQGGAVTQGDASSTTESSTSAVSSTGVSPLEPVVGTDLAYFLLAYGEDSRESTGHPAGKISNFVLSALKNEAITDVFLFSHGWRGDIPAAREQYQGWLATMSGCQQDRQKIRQQRPGFRPLLVGLHWPSEPFGDESFGETSEAVFNGQPDDELEREIELYATRLGNKSQTYGPLRVILNGARQAGPRDPMSGEILKAYRELDRAVALRKGGVAAAPGEDWEKFQPQRIFREAKADAQVQEGISDFFSRDTLLAPLRVLSFWKMKARARTFGESAVQPLLRQMQELTAGRDVRFHIAGHSFGCIVASAAIAGAADGAKLPRAVDSLTLLQGALSLWSYCRDIPEAPGQSGYFHSLVANKMVRGPLVTSQSKFDSAVGTWYPRAARVARQVTEALDQFPKYGAVGSFGIQGSDLAVQGMTMRDRLHSYNLQPGRIYNVNGDAFINTGVGLSGAHSDIRKPEVAHLVWEAITSV